VDPIEAKALVNHHALAAAGSRSWSRSISAKWRPALHFSALPLRISGGLTLLRPRDLWQD